METTLIGYSGFMYYQMGWTPFSVNAPTRAAADAYAASLKGHGPRGYVTGASVDREWDAPFTCGRTPVVDENGIYSGRLM